MPDGVKFDQISRLPFFDLIRLRGGNLLARRKPDETSFLAEHSNHLSISPIFLRLAEAPTSLDLVKIELSRVTSHEAVIANLLFFCRDNQSADERFDSVQSVSGVDG